MTAVILGEAEREFAKSVEYYESKAPGLGTRFRNEVAKYRRMNLREFPHYIAYVLFGEIIWIVAIAHGHRRPEFWTSRI